MPSIPPPLGAQRSATEHLPSHSANLYQYPFSYLQSWLTCPILIHLMTPMQMSLFRDRKHCLYPKIDMGVSVPRVKWQTFQIMNQSPKLASREPPSPPADDLAPASYSHHLCFLDLCKHFPSNTNFLTQNKTKPPPTKNFAVHQIIT